MRWSVCFVLLLFLPLVGAQGAQDARHVSLERDGDQVVFSHEGTSWFTMELGRVEWSRDGNQIRGESAQGVLLVTDTPRPHVSFRGQDPNVQFLDAEVTRHDKGLLVEKEGKTAFVREEQQRRYFFTFQLRADDRADQREQAVEDRRVAARVRDQTVETYEDMDVSVQRPDRATPETPYRIVMDGNFSEGRTIVLDLEPNMVRGALQMRYFNVHENGAETEVLFHEASSLEDVLDPTNDGGQPEYWVVRDADGLQVLVSVPQWSTHAVTLAGLGEVVQPQVWLGLTAAALLTGVAGRTLFRAPRKP